MATVSVSYLWIALKVRGPQERAAGEAIFSAAGLFQSCDHARACEYAPEASTPTKGLTGGLNRQPDG